jgi:hypothetical protein
MGMASLCGIVDNFDGRWPSQRGASLRTLFFSLYGRGSAPLLRFDPGAFFNEYHPDCFTAIGMRGRLRACAGGIQYVVCFYAASYPSYFFFHHLLGLVSGIGEECVVCAKYL